MAKVEPVIYGGIIQLYHVKSAGALASGKLSGHITVIPEEIRLITRF